MPEPTPQLEQELAAAPVVAAPSAVGAAPDGRVLGADGRLGAGVLLRPGGPAVGLRDLAGLRAAALRGQPGGRAARRPADVPRPHAAAGTGARRVAEPGPARRPGRRPAGPSAPARAGRPAQTPNPPDAANPSSGINWDEFWSGNAPNVIRTFLEVARLYPGWGLLAGGAADLMNAKQDFEAIQGEDAPEIKAFMAGRHAVAILNNGIGHVIYVVELVQDIATASVVGAEVDAITVPLNEILLGIKVGVDSVQFLADFGLTCAAQYRSMKAPPGPAGAASRAAWDGMVANYEANLVGDLVGGIFDIIDLSSAGFSNSQPVKQGAKAVKATFDTAKLVKGLIKSVLQGWFGVWGGKAFERGAPGGGVHGIAERAAGGVILQRAAGDEGLLHGRRHDDRRGRGPHRQAADRAQPGRDDRARRQGPVHHGARRGGRGARARRAADRRPRPDAGAGDDGAEKTAAIETWCTETGGKVNAPAGPEHPDPGGRHRRRRALRPRRGRAEHGRRGRRRGPAAARRSAQRGRRRAEVDAHAADRHDQGRTRPTSASSCRSSPTRRASRSPRRRRGWPTSRRSWRSATASRTS